MSAWQPSRMEGLQVMRPRAAMDTVIDDMIERYIRLGTLPTTSPYAGWTVKQFQAQRQQHISASRAPTGRKPATHCKNNHLLDAANTDTSVNRRRCRQCARDYSKRYEEEHRKGRGHLDQKRGWVQPNSNQRTSASHLEDPR